MRETIHLAVGKCGVAAFTRIAACHYSERNVGLDGSFEQQSIQAGTEATLELCPSGKYRIRGILVDSDPDSLPAFSQLIATPVPTVHSSESNGNNWAQGRYAASALSESVIEELRKSADRCESLESIQVVHSVGGGTGSGLVSRLLPDLNTHFPGVILSSTTVLPSPQVSDIVVEPYNAILALSTLLDTATGIVAIDNQALMRIMNIRYKLKTPTYGDLNHLIGRYVSSAMSVWALPSQLRWTYSKLLTSLTPFPSMPLLELGFAPLTCRCLCFPPRTFPEEVSHLLQREFSLCIAEAVAPTMKFQAAVLGFRGNTQSMRVEEVEEYAPLAYSWARDSLRVNVSDVAPFGLKYGISLISNHSGVEVPLRRIYDDEQSMRRRNAFLHWYTDQGMEATELDAAEEKVRATLAEYQALTE